MGRAARYECCVSATSQGRVGGGRFSVSIASTGVEHSHTLCQLRNNWPHPHPPPPLHPEAHVGLLSAALGRGMYQ